LFIALLLAYFAIAHSAIAVTPDSDGGYPDANTAGKDSALLDLNTGTATPTPSFPLKKSPNNRYLATQNGTPFLIVGDSPWELTFAGQSQKWKHPHQKSVGQKIRNPP
jgi:hypothetical protein